MSGGPTNKAGIGQAQGGINTANNLSNLYSSGGQGVLSTLEPQLVQDATNPAGFGASGMAAMNTAAKQSTGGATAGAVGAMGRRAAATGNAGGFSAAAAEAARSGQREGSQRSVEIAGENEKLKQQQRESAVRQLGDLYRTDVTGSLGALGDISGLINAETGASKSQGGVLDTLMKLNQMAATDAALS